MNKTFKTLESGKIEITETPAIPAPRVMEITELENEQAIERLEKGIESMLDSKQKVIVDFDESMAKSQEEIDERIKLRKDYPNPSK